MELRTIQYGYKLSGQHFIENPAEAEIVREIFNRYISGKTLKSIAEDLTSRGIVYYKEKNTWSKNAICRIIESDKYIGNDGYTKIIDTDVFHQAQYLKNTKGGKREKDSDIVQFIKEHVVCAQCGKRYIRRNKWGNREKWMCSNGCHTDSYVDDGLLYRQICSAINKAISSPEVIRINHSVVKWEPSLDVIREEKEISRMREQANLQFHTIKQAVFDCASAKFDCCHEDNTGEFSNKLMECLEKHDLLTSIDIDLLTLCVKMIMVKKNAEVSIRLVNGADISNETEDNENGSTDLSENNYKNRSKSASSVKAES